MSASLPLAVSLGPLESRLVDLGDAQLFLPVAMLVAVVLGAGHACAPGHGKALAAGYLLGGQGRGRDAVLFGLVVAAMHTISVVVLGVAWWLLVDTAPLQDGVTAWLRLIAALLVLAVGVTLVRRQVRARRVPVHASGAEDLGRHGHHHGHGHDHHLPAGKPLLTRSGLVLLGTSGGLLPSPSAFLVLVTGLLTGHVLAAGALVTAFGAGMASTLAGVGWLTLRSRDLLLARAAASPRLQVITSTLPLLAGGAVLLGGAALSVAAAARVLSS